MAASASFLGTPATAPGPQGPDMLRAFSLIRKNPLGFLDKTWRTYGDVSQFPIPRPPTYLINSPTAVRRVLVNNAKSYDKETIQYRALSLMTGDGLLTADTKTWRIRRPMIQPEFHQVNLNALIPTTMLVTDQLREQWVKAPRGGVIDVDQYMLNAALQVVGTFLFGSDLSDNAQSITRATLEGLDVVIARARVPISPPARIPTPGNRKLARSLRVLDSSVAAILSDRSGSGDSLIDVLRAARDPSGRPLTRQQIRNEIVTFIVAGHETVASALSWCWAYLADNPHVQEQVAREADALRIHQAKPDGSEGPDVSATLAQMPYTTAVFNEVLRLYPPAWLITRKALEPDELDGHHIPAGALTIVSPSLLHRHPEIWEHPEEFRPERFLEKFPRESFIPFGAGLRQCIGKDFAYVEGVLILAELTRAFFFSFPTGRSFPAADPLVTIRPRGGVELVVTPRG